MKSNDAFHEWSLNFLSESNYQRLIIPIVEQHQSIPVNDLKLLYQSLTQASKPPQELLDRNCENSFNSIFELFIKNMYDKSMPIKLFVKLTDYIPTKRQTLFFCSFLNSLEFFDFIRILPYLPHDNKVKYMGYCKLLYNDKTFLSAFSFLIQNYNMLSNDMKKNFNRCFRKSLEKGICNNLLIDMTHIAFEFAPLSIVGINNNKNVLQNPKQSEALDMFFSALTDNMTILNNLCKIKNINSLFEDCTIRNDLPQSFLRFLLYTSLNYNFTTDQLFSFIHNSPTYFFTYVNHLDDTYNETMWIQILSVEISLDFSQQTYEFHKNTLLAFLLCVLQRPHLITLFTELRVDQQFHYFFKVKISSFSRDYSLLSLFILYLSFSRIDENIASVIAESNDENNRCFRKSISNFDIISHDLTDDFCKIALTKSCTNIRKGLTLRTLLSIIIDQGDELVEDALLWLFSPQQPFPIEGLMKLESEQNFSIFPYPSYTFIKEIAPSILRPMIQSKNEVTITKILNLIKIPDNVVLFKEISSPDLLHPYLEKSLENPVYYRLITTALSISCDFSIFSPVFKSICTDIEKTIDFLTILSKKTLLVDDYLYINDEYFLPNPVMNGTICMWIRPHSKNAKIFTVTTPEVKIDVYHEFNDFFLYANYFEKEKEKDKENDKEKNKERKFNYKLYNITSIEGWYFLSLSLTPKSATFSVNLESTSFKVSAGNKATMSIGSTTGIFDLQVLKIQRPSISQGQINYTFSLGPNYKESIIPDFFSIQYPQPLFVNNNSYISNLYLKWANIFSNTCRITKSSSESFKSFEELSISPPFQKKSTSRKSAYSILKVDNFESILERRLTFTSFLNSFDAQGGIPFLIHIWAEVLLNKVTPSPRPDLPSPSSEFESNCCEEEPEIPNSTIMVKTFDLITVLLNKYPLFHHYFVRNSVYCLIGQLMKHSPVDALPRAISRENSLITNIHIIKYWVLGPPLEGREFPDAIKTLIDISSIPQNQKLMSDEGFFAIIVRHISHGNRHSAQFLKLLSSLAMSLTTPETCLANATFLFNVLMVQHLQFSEESAKEAGGECRSLVLVRLMFSMLETFSELNTKLNLELMIPAVIPATSYQADLIILLINHLDETMLYIFSVVLMLVPSRPELSEQIYKSVSRRLHDNKIILKKAHIITLPLVYFASHVTLSSDRQEDFFALCSAASFILDTFTSPYPLFVYEEMLQIICSLECIPRSEEIKATNSFILPQVITKEFFNPSSSMPPFVSLLATMLPRALINNDKENVEKFFISIFAIQKVPIYRKKGISLFLIGKLFEKLIEIHSNNSDNNLSNLIKEGQIEPFLKFCLSFGSFAFQKIQMIPGDKSESVSLICCYFLKQVFLFGEILDSSDVLNAEISTLVDFSSLNSISSLIVEHIVGLKKLSKHKKFAKTIDRLRNPTGYPPIKISHQKFEKKLEILTQKFQKQDSLNKNGLLTIICNSLQYQTASAGEINFVDENEEKIIETWHQIFNKLHFPSSRIFENCPNKYTVNDKTTRFERRRTLLPINPSADSLYTSFYQVKYQSELPKIRLTLSELFENTSMSQFHGNDVSFSGDAVRLTGISLLKGIIVILQDQIKFYQKMYTDVITFKFKDIKYIKLIDYMHQPRGILVENCNDDIYLFAFEAQSIRDCFIELCEGFKKFVILKEIEKVSLEEITNQWRDGLISNFDYLLKLNIMSGRTWADFTQFPVFPWTLKDFASSNIDISDPKFYRNLEFPLFAQSDEQKDAIQQYYVTISDVSTPHHFPKYISNVGSTLYFLVRLEPFTDAELDFQGGKLDCADRTFHSFQISYEIMTTPGSKSSLELVPEVYFFPEMLENINGVSFGSSTKLELKKLTSNESNDEEIPHDVSQVLLPCWCKSPNNFVDIMRDALESNVVSQSLNEWIDLIWGFRRQGKGGLERYNILQDIVFDFNPEEYIDDYSMMKAMSETIHNCGQAPCQLFDSPHPKKRVFTSMKEITLVPITKLTEDGSSLIPKTFTHNLTSQQIFIDSKNDSILIYRNSVISVSFRFSKEISPVAIAIDQNYQNIGVSSSSNLNYQINGSSSAILPSSATKKRMFVTAHQLPVVNHWQLTKKGLKHLATLRGRLTHICCFLLDSSMAIILAGHIDGYISIFSTNPHVFIREIKGQSEAPIFMMRLVKTKGNIISFQKDEKNLLTIITMWTINGQILGELKIPDIIIDCVVSSFAEGTVRNIMVLLTNNDELIIIKERDFNDSVNDPQKLEKIQIGSGGHTSLQIWKNIIFAIRKDRSHTTFSLEISK